jgi:hypothetical protein
MWWRTTICFRKIDGKWMVTHEHNSVPFDVPDAILKLRELTTSAWQQIH